MLTLNQLSPGTPDEVEAVAAYAYPEGRWLRANMVSSVDGAAVLEGRVASLSGPADHALLLLLRSLADVLVVGAGTLRAEGSDRCARRPSWPTYAARPASRRTRDLRC